MATAARLPAGPRAGTDYPSSLIEFLDWFRSDEDCARYLARLRWEDAFIGGVKTGGKRGRRAAGKACLVIAVESQEKGFGRCRLQVVEKIDAVQLGEFLHRSIGPGSVVISDALRCCPLAIADTYGHKPFTIKRSGLHAHEVLPGVQRVASLLKRWLAGTHQSGVSVEHLQAYLDEFTFRFNRRHSRARGLG